MTVKQLKDKCKELGLRVSGNKSILIKRIENPTKEDISKKDEWVMVGLGWGDEKTKAVSNLVEKGFASFNHYATDKFFYKIKKEKWRELLFNEKKNKS